MSKWISDTLGLQSKKQLKSHRMDLFRGSCLKAGLFFESQIAWTDEEKVLARQLWSDADEDYEIRKTELRKALSKLSELEISTYFCEIEEEKKDISVFLPISPAPKA